VKPADRPVEIATVAVDRFGRLSVDDARLPH
jgi:hypothetical protein